MDENVALFEEVEEFITVADIRGIIIHLATQLHMSVNNGRGIKPGVLATMVMNQLSASSKFPEDGLIYLRGRILAIIEELR